MSTISPSDFKKLLDEIPSPTVIDVRTPREFEEIHIPAARNIPLHTLAPKQLIESGKLPATDPIYILCHSGSRAQKAADKFLTEGYKNALVVEGGTLAWIKAGLPVSRGEIKIISLERQIRIAAGALVLMGVILGWFVHRAFFGISAFVGVGLIFAGITDWCGMGLLLAKAPWNQHPRP